MDPRTVAWREHPTTAKWHAFAPGVERSVCRYTSAGGAPAPAVPRGGHACLFCWGMVCPGLPRPEVRDAPEEQDVECLGGPWDGVRLTLLVTRRDGDHLRVHAMGYTRRPRRGDPCTAPGIDP
jgi:hypothetical protein